MTVVNKEYVDYITQQRLKDIGIVSTLPVLRGSIAVCCDSVNNGEALNLPNNFQEFKRGGGTFHYV